MEEERKNSLLIVDDEKANLIILTHILGADYTIYSATSGLSAIEKAKEYKPDLILLDILMPDMEGYETLAELRKYEEVQEVPVIFITGLSSDKDEEKGLSLDAADYIAKPFNTMVVKLRVRNQIQIINQIRTIQHLSMMDQLTNLPNRRCFDGRLQTEWNLAKRERTSISILMIDVDKFKIFNDTYGHQHGDVVLQTVANIFSQAFRRPTDFAARWGGEEFIILLPNTPLAGAMEVAEKIRGDVEKAIIPCQDGSITKVTISVGLNTQMPDQNSSMDAFISKADLALYAAKEAGRNRISSAVNT